MNIFKSIQFFEQQVSTITKVTWTLEIYKFLRELKTIFFQEWSRTSLTNPGGVPETLSSTGANEGMFRNSNAAEDLTSLGFHSTAPSSRGRRANTLLSDLLQVEYVRARNSLVYGSERENEMWSAAR